MLGHAIEGGLLLGRGIGQVELSDVDEGQVGVDPDDVVGVRAGQRRGDERAPIPALGAVAVVAQPAHEFVPRPGGAVDVPSRRRRLAAEAIAGERRHDDVERVGRVVGPAEGVDDVEELHDRARPTMGE
jgi:hypothetical protein